MQINRKSPRTVVHSSRITGGYGITSPNHIQLSSIISTVLKGLRTNCPWRKLLIILIRFTQLYIGHPQPPFQGRCPEYVPSNWISSVWKILFSNNITIVIKKKYLLPLRKQRVHDQYIMQNKRLSNLTPNQVLHVNKFRMYLHAIYDSDITSVSGNIIKRSILKHIPIRSKYNWPNTPRPSQVEWKSWHMYIKKSLHPYNDRSLVYPLGSWIFGVFHQDHDAYISQSRVIFTFQPSGIVEYHSTSPRIYRARNKYPIINIPQYEPYIPIKVVSKGPTTLSINKVSAPKSQSKELNCIPPHHFHDWSKYKCNFCPHQCHKVLLIATDGSYKIPNNNSAFVIAKLPYEIILTGSSHPITHPALRSSYDAEIHAVMIA